MLLSLCVSELKEALEAVKCSYHFAAAGMFHIIHCASEDYGQFYCLGVTLFSFIVNTAVLSGSRGAKHSIQNNITEIQQKAFLTAKGSILVGTQIMYFVLMTGSDSDLV